MRSRSETAASADDAPRSALPAFPNFGPFGPPNPFAFAFGPGIGMGLGPNGFEALVRYCNRLAGVPVHWPPSFNPLLQQACAPPLPPTAVSAAAAHSSTSSRACSVCALESASALPALSPLPLSIASSFDPRSSANYVIDHISGSALSQLPLTLRSNDFPIPISIALPLSIDQQRDSAAATLFSSSASAPNSASPPVSASERVGPRRCKRCRCPNCQARGSGGGGSGGAMAGLRAGSNGDAASGNGGRRLHCCHVPGCGKLYGKTSHLRAHLRGHLGQRPFTCHWLWCGKSFTRYFTVL